MNSKRKAFKGDCDMITLVEIVGHTSIQKLDRQTFVRFYLHRRCTFQAPHNRI